jgi:hypothetical protein
MLVHNTRSPSLSRADPPSDNAPAAGSGSGNMLFTFTGNSCFGKILYSSLSFLFSPFQPHSADPGGFFKIRFDSSAFAGFRGLFSMISFSGFAGPRKVLYLSMTDEANHQCFSCFSFNRIQHVQFPVLTCCRSPSLA